MTSVGSTTWDSLRHPGFLLLLLSCHGRPFVGRRENYEKNIQQYKRSRVFSESGHEISIQHPRIARPRSSRELISANFHSTYLGTRVERMCSCNDLDGTTRSSPIFFHVFWITSHLAGLAENLGRKVDVLERLRGKDHCTGVAKSRRPKQLLRYLRSQHNRRISLT